MRKPLIGISANLKENKSTLTRQYYEAVILAGGVPIIIPITTDNEALTQIIRSLDGLVMSGGADIDPKYFDEKPIPELGDVIPLRDEYDVKLIELAHSHQVPILGICRGMQVMNVVFGGSLYQDIAVQYDGFLLKHNQDAENIPRSITTQTALIRCGSNFEKIIGCEELQINSAHHQAVNRVAAGFTEVAFTQDGICEAIESDYYAEIGVQWHPEHLATACHCGLDPQSPENKDSNKLTIAGQARNDNNNANLNIFEWLINEAKIFNRAKNIHKTYLTLDSHCDTPMFFDYGIDICKNNDEITLNIKDLGEDEDRIITYKTKVDIPKMQDGLLDAAFMVAYIQQKELDEKSLNAAVEKTNFLLNKIIYQVSQNTDIVEVATCVDDLLRLKNEGKKAIFLCIENGYGLGKDLENIEKFYKLGVRYITLCHNGDNLICDSAVKTQNMHGGLSDFGKKVVQKMNELGIMIDISHAGESTFWDVIKHSTKPIIASHCCSKTIQNHPRNLTDEQITALAKNGGVCQICLYKDFLTDLPIAAIENVIEHIKHIVNLVGIDYVGIGSDFDGDGEIFGCLAANELINITKALIKNNFSDEDISKILGGNFLRVMKNQK